jgi:hypothetical protein
VTWKSFDLGLRRFSRAARRVEQSKLIGRCLCLIQLMSTKRRARPAL